MSIEYGPDPTVPLSDENQVTLAGSGASEPQVMSSPHFLRKRARIRII